MTRPFFRIASIAAIGLCVLATSSCKDDPKNIEPLVINFKKEGELSIKKSENDSLIASLDIEIADNEYETQTGMMYRDSLKRGQGMLFIFEKADYHSFYMKNTRIPLDIIYFDADKKITGIRKNAQPYDETSLPSDGPAQFVLEVNAGLSDIWKLEAGDRIEFTKE